MSAAAASGGPGSSSRTGLGIGTASASALVAGNMLGAGVFTTSGFALADLGRREWVLFAWIVGAVIAACGAHAYASLARRMPGNGGEYLYLSRSLHPLAGFLAGWVSLFAGFTAPIAVAAHGLEAYAAAAFEIALPPHALGAGVILACGLAHGVRRGTGLGVQNGAVALKVVAIAGFLAFGAWRLLGYAADAAAEVGSARAAVATPELGATSGGLAAFAVTLVWVSFAYSGWNAAVYVADELVRPERTLPRALRIATVGVGVVYVALNAVFLWAAPIERLAGTAEVAAVAAEALGGDTARMALSAIVALALVTSISAMVMVGPRVTAQMADDGLLPPGLGRGGQAAVDVPRAAVALQVALALGAFFLGSLRELLLYSGFLLGLSAAATVAFGLWRPLAAESGTRISSGTRATSSLFVVATLGSAGFMLAREPMQAWVGLGTLASGAVAYAFASWADWSRRRPGSAGLRPR